MGDETHTRGLPDGGARMLSKKEEGMMKIMVILVLVIHAMSDEEGKTLMKGKEELHPKRHA